MTTSAGRARDGAALQSLPEPPQGQLGHIVNGRQRKAVRRCRDGA